MTADFKEQMENSAYLPSKNESMVNVRQMFERSESQTNQIKS